MGKDMLGYWGSLNLAMNVLEGRVEALEAWRVEIDPEAATCGHKCHESNLLDWNYCTECGESL